MNIKETKEDIIDDLSHVQRHIDKAKEILTEDDLEFAIINAKRHIIRAKRVINFQLRKIDEIQKAENQP